MQKRKRSTTGTFAPAFKDAEELRAKVDAFFEDCKANNKIPNEFGLALFLGISRNTLRYHWHEGIDIDEESLKVIIEAYDRIADSYIQLLQNGDKNMSSPVIFLLKQKQFGGYQDKIEEKKETTVKIIHDDSITEDDFK